MPILDGMTFTVILAIIPHLSSDSKPVRAERDASPNGAAQEQADGDRF